MYELVFLSICIIKVGFGSDDCNITNVFIKQETFEDTIITDHSLWSKSGRESSADCASECGRDDQCVSFFYNTRTDLCVAHPVQFHPNDTRDVEEGNVYYTKPIGELLKQGSPCLHT